LVCWSLSGASAAQRLTQASGALNPASFEEVGFLPLETERHEGLGAAHSPIFNLHYCKIHSKLQKRQVILRCLIEISFFFMKFKPAHLRRDRGVALVLVLCFVVLLTGFDSCALKSVLIQRLILRRVWTIPEAIFTPTVLLTK